MSAQMAPWRVAAAAPLCSVLDGYSRSIVHWDLRESMREALPHNTSGFAARYAQILLAKWVQPSTDSLEE